jgi:hypothetical protein
MPGEDAAPGRSFAGLGPLSRRPAERSLQHVVIAMAVAGIGALLVYAGIVVFSGALGEQEPGESTAFADSPGYEQIRLGVVVAAVLLAARLAQLAVRHRGEMSTVAGLRRQYLTLCVLGCLLYNVFIPWPAFVVQGVVAVYLLTLPTAPPEHRQGPITGGTSG